MADKAIRVAVLDGDFASLCALGFPLSLGIQLQQSYLKLSEAHWTARSTSGGFSVSFFWPAPENTYTSGSTMWWFLNNFFFSA